MAAKDRAAAREPEHVYDALNERVVICAAIADAAQRKYLVHAVAPDEFLAPGHAPIWRAMRIVVDQGIEYSPAVMRRFVADEGGGVDDAYLEQLESRAAVPPNLAWHVETMRWDATRARVLSGPVPELVGSLTDPKADPSTVESAARAVLRSVEGGATRRHISRPDELGASYDAELQARVTQGNFWSLGWSRSEDRVGPMDHRLVEGAMPKRTCVVSGVSGSGKSSFACSMALEMANAGRRVFYCAWEMGVHSTLDVMVSQSTGIPLFKIMQGSLSPEELARVRRVVAWLTSRMRFMGNPFFTEEYRSSGKSGGRRSNDRSLDIVEGYLAEAACDVVVMDLWERCLVDLSYEGVTKALYRQQDMHDKYNCWGVIVQQLTLKEIERRSDKRPTRDAVKGTGAYVDVADLLFGVHREAMFKSVPDDTLEVICLKQRKGPAFWAIQFGWEAECSRLFGGKEVEYDPGLEVAKQFGGDVAALNTGRSGRGRKGKRKRGADDDADPVV